MLLKFTFKHKKFISFLLILCTVFSMCSQLLTVFAVDGSGLVESAEKGNISDYSELNDIGLSETEAIKPNDALLTIDHPSIAKESMISKYVNAEAFNKASHIERLHSEEDLNTYVFLNANGTKSIYYMDENVKYVDKNGDVKEKDISLVSKSDGYGIARNEFDLHIPISATTGISMSYNGYEVKITPQSTARTAPARQAGEAVVYDGFFGSDTVLKYTPMLSGVKEDIILNKYIPNASFSFILETDGLGLYCNENGYYLAESESSKAVLNLGKVIVYDAVGKPEYGTMTVKTVSDKQKYILSLSAPEEFLADSTTVYPVTIDPNLKISDNESGEGAIEDTVLFSGRPTKNYGDYKYLSIGYVDSTYGVGRVAVKLPGLYNSADYNAITASNISSVKFYCWDTTGNSAQMVNLYAITSAAWNENTVTYGDAVTYSTEDNWHKSMPSGAWTDFDITTLVKGWKNGYYSSDKGFILVNSNETSASYKKAPYSSEATTTTYRPYVVMNYAPSNSHDITNGGVTVEIEEGETCYLTATNPYSIPFTWTSSDSAIATVSNTGMLTAHKAGKVTITASFFQNGATLSTSCTVYVYFDVDAFYIKNIYSELYLKAKNSSIKDLTKVNQYAKYDSNGSAADEKYEIHQLWRINHLHNGIYSIRPLYKLDMALHITGTSADVFTVGNIDTLDHVPLSAQWEISWNGSNYLIKNVSTGKTLQMANGNTTLSANATVGSYTGSAWQKWALVREDSAPEGVAAYNATTGSSYSSNGIPSKAIVIGETKTLNDLNLVVVSYQTISPGNLVRWSTNNSTVASVSSNGTVTANSCGTATIKASYNGKEISYELYVIPFADGTYFFKNKDTEKYMQPDDNGDSHIENHTLDGTDEQKWIFESLGNGYYKIVSLESGLALSVPAGYETSSGINIIQETYLGYDRQQWEFVEVSEGEYKIRARSSPGFLVLCASDTSSDAQIKQNVYVSDNDYLDEWQPIRMLPTNGHELDYDAVAWAGIPSDNNNCYAYAINNQVEEPTGNTIWFKQQPGEYYNKHNGNDSDIPESFQKPASVIVSSVQSDFSKYNEVNQTSCTFASIGRYEICPVGTYKVALVVSNDDYHWYRQDSDGFWSHKRGTSSVKRTDESGDLIIDPMLADRDNYTTFVGYFSVKPWNNMYHSSKSNEFVQSFNLTTTISDELLSKVKIGMSYNDVVKLLPHKGIDIGSGTIIQKYLSTSGFLYIFEYTSYESEFVVSKIRIEGKS